jgi:signal transduction histidine kinase
MGFATKEQLEEALKEQSKMVEVYKSLESEKLGATIEIGFIVNSTLNLATVLALIMGHANRVTSSIASTLMLLDDKTGELVVRVPTGPKSDKLTDICLPSGKGIVGWVAENGRPALVPNVREDLRFSPEIDAISGFETDSILCVPLKAKTRLIGVLEAINKVDGTSFTEEDELLLSVFGYQAAMAIENARHYGELKDRLEEVTRAHKEPAEDIVERKRAEEEQTRLLAELKAKNRELESFTYTVSHSLKAPLVSLSGLSSVLRNQFHNELSEEGKHYLERIEGNVAHMDALIRDLLELSRIGQVVGSVEEIDTQALLREIREELAIDSEHGGADFVVHEPLPAVSADRDRIRQVFANLIDNAVKFRSKERALRIEVGCQEEKGFYRFHVADNGIGITPQHHEKIFDPFHQLDPNAEGMGIGLALVKKIVEQHGGRIWVESEEGGGATFYFTLPIERGA